MLIKEEMTFFFIEFYVNCAPRGSIPPRCILYTLSDGRGFHSHPIVYPWFHHTFARTISYRTGSRMGGHNRGWVRKYHHRVYHTQQNYSYCLSQNISDSEGTIGESSFLFIKKRFFFVTRQAQILRAYLFY